MFCSPYPVTQLSLLYIYINKFCFNNNNINNNKHFQLRENTLLIACTYRKQVGIYY